jgi:hypothetical protein
MKSFREKEEHKIRKQILDVVEKTKDPFVQIEKLKLELYSLNASMFLCDSTLARSREERDLLKEWIGNNDYSS